MVRPLLLSLLPLSCIVIPTGKLANKHFLTTNISSTITSHSQAFTLPTVFPSSNTGIDFLAGSFSNNYDEMRDRSLSTNINISRNLSISFTKSSVVYYDRIESNNAMVINDKMVDTSPSLSYETDKEKALCVSKAAEQQANMRPKCNNLMASNSNPQYVLNKKQQPTTTHGSTTQTKDNNVINIQLPYNPQAPTELDLWSGNFHPISLYGSIEYIASDAKNIKDSLNFIARYCHKLHSACISTTSGLIFTN